MLEIPEACSELQMRPSEQFLLVMVRTLQAIRRECRLDEVIQRQITGVRGLAAHLVVTDQHDQSVAQQLALVRRLEGQLPEAVLQRLLSAVEPDGRDARALGSELAYRARRSGSRGFKDCRPGDHCAAP